MVGDFGSRDPAWTGEKGLGRAEGPAPYQPMAAPWAGMGHHVRGGLKARYIPRDASGLQPSVPIPRWQPMATPWAAMPRAFGPLRMRVHLRAASWRAEGPATFLPMAAPWAGGASRSLRAEGPVHAPLIPFRIRGSPKVSGLVGSRGNCRWTGLLLQRATELAGR